METPKQPEKNNLNISADELGRDEAARIARRVSSESERIRGEVAQKAKTAEVPVNWRTNINVEPL